MPETHRAIKKEIKGTEYRDVQDFLNANATNSIMKIK